jgi:nicotinamidase-related amidase
MFNYCFRKLYRFGDNVEKHCRAGQVTDDNIVRPMPIACCIPKGTDTHSEYVIFIAFPLQQWLHERASVLI